MTYPTDDTPLILREARGEQLRMYVSIYKGKSRLHLRKFWFDEKDALWKPSKEGVSLNQEELTVLLPMLQEVKGVNVLS
jgi:Transcriptional Coactivator p15 (PC4)